MMIAPTWLVVPLALFASPTEAVTMSDHVHGCTVQTEEYRLVVDVGESPMVRVLSADGEMECAHVVNLPVWDGDRRYRLGDDAPQPHFHPLRSGRYLVEVHIEGIILADETGQWPGLAELSLYCHEDRVFIVAAFLRPEGEWVNRGQYVYRTPESHRSCPTLDPKRLGLSVTLSNNPVTLHNTVPEGAQQAVDGRTTTVFSEHDGTWDDDEARRVGCCIVFGNAGESPPLAAGAFEATMGEALGYEAATGLYRVRAQTSGTPEPPRGLLAGARYTVRNDATPRRILVDQLDPWGGISGGIVRDGDGLPLPIPIQFGLNFPEMHGEAGEPGWATLTYPLELAPNETREVHAQHIYHGLGELECIYLTSLDNIGDPLLLQTTVGRGESHTLTTGAYPQALLPGNELRVNDFRRIYSQIVSRSVSAILPTFFGYWDAAGAYQGLMPGHVSFRETGPFLTDYTIGAATADGAVSGALRVWQAAHADMTRIFTEVSLDVTRDIDLSSEQPAPLFFLRHHAFNPMAFGAYAYTAEDGSPRAGELTYARTVVENGTAMGEQPFAAIYAATNGLDNGLPCSDITGNSGFVVLDWDVELGGEPVRPGAYAFCTGEGDPDGAYARDVAVVPTERLTRVPAGSHVRYRAVQFVYGDAESDHAPAVLERERWALRPLTVEATVGTVVSSDPPEIAAADGRVEATLSGGADWVPVRVSGFDASRPLRVEQTDSTGARTLGPGAEGEPWYNAWTAEDGTCGFTFLVKTDPTGEPVKLVIRQ